MGHRLRYRIGCIYHLRRIFIKMTPPKEKQYNTLKKMNRPIRFFGLSPLQFSAFTGGLFLLIILLIFAKASSFIITVTITAICTAFILLVKKLQTAHKKGNPDYLAGKNIRSATPGKIIDKSLYFKLIKF